MELPQNVVPMPAEQRAELKQLAEQATPGPWSAGHLSDDNSTCNCPWVMSAGLCGSICTIDVDNGLPIGEGGNDSPPLAEAKANQRYIAAVSPDITLATLSYVEALEAEVARLGKELGDYTEAFRKRRQEWRAEQLRDADAIQAATSRATKAETRLSEAQVELAEQGKEKLALVNEIEAYKLVHQGMQTKWHAILRQVMSPLPSFEEAVRTGKAMQRAGYTPETSILNCEKGCEVCESTPPPSSPAAAGPGEASEFFLNGDPAINPFGPR